MPNLNVASPRSIRNDHGLFSVLDVRKTERWSEGITWPAMPPISGYRHFDLECEPPTFDLTETVGGGFSEATSFAVYETHTCAPVGRDLEDARTALEAREQTYVEQAVWAKLKAGTPTAGPTNLSPEAAVAWLIGWAATFLGVKPVLHIPADVAVRASGLLEMVGDTLVTKVTAAPVVAGAGYVGNFDGATPVYPNPAPVAYVTYPMLGYASDVYTVDWAETFDRANNVVTTFAARDWVLGLDTSTYASVGITV